MNEVIKIFTGPHEIIEGRNIYLHSLSRIFDINAIETVVVVTDKYLTAKFESELAQIKSVAPDEKLEFFFIENDITAEIIEKFHKALNGFKGKKIAVIGFGGGKVMDLSKSVYYDFLNVAGVTLITFPTSPSTCAAYSSHIVIYNQDGQFQKTLAPAGTADYLILDYSILENIPPRLLASGIADSIAKYIECRAHFEADDDILLEVDAGAEIAFLAAKTIFNRLLNIAPQALESLLNRQSSAALESVIKLCVIETGIVGAYGGYKCRAALGHAIGDYMTHLTPRGGEFDMHGLRVAYGLLVQMLCEKRSDNEMIELIEFYIKLGLPLTLSDFTLKHDLLSTIESLILKIYSGESSIRNMKHVPEQETVKNALIHTASKNF
ncbi:MAG: iron-containing alcohol dehydrogenase [Candidatus Wallbacteria bacterium]